MEQDKSAVEAEARAEIHERAERSKREILDDIAAGTVPATVGTFSELHDYVDANEYGGCCEDGVYERLDDLEARSGWGVFNAIQDNVDQWLRAGRPTTN